MRNLKELERKHFNRMREIIRNPKNTKKHFESIHEMVENYRSMFGITKLYLKLLEYKSNSFINIKH